MNTAHPAMNSVLFLVLRRMRLPLILLVVSYAVSILGMSLMPGVDAQGRPSAGMSLFHAFYFVSYTATTIGFGELPTAFSEAQRAWATLTIYLTVLVWLYSIGTILTLLQDAAFRRVLEAASFQRQVRRLRQPFYILCGCGETGSLLLQSLDLRNQQAVVLDMDGERISELELGQYRLQIPALAADVRVPANLEMAGLGHPACAGVVALTNDDRANLSVAVTTKLLRPELPVLARADQLDTAENMASFGTNQIVNGFELFGELLGNALHNPGQYLLYDWLTDLPGTPLVEPLRPPRGKWVICGYGRFGRAVVRNLRREQVDVVVIDTDALRGDCDECIRGDAAETDVQLEAGVKGAAAIVAGTDDDVSNLSIVMTARKLNPGLFVVVRQNRHDNATLFQRFNAHITMQPAGIVGHEFLSLLTTPLLSRFFAVSRTQPEAWANELIARILALVTDTVPEVWDVHIADTDASAVTQALKDNGSVLLGDLLRDPSDRDAQLPCIALLIERPEALLPDLDTPVFPGDRYLFCGAPGIRHRQALALRNAEVLDYLTSGVERYTRWPWRGKGGNATSRQVA